MLSANVVRHTHVHASSLLGLSCAVTLYCKRIYTLINIFPFCHIITTNNNVLLGNYGADEHRIFVKISCMVLFFLLH